MSLSNTTAYGWVLRDMMQSTGVWCFDKEQLTQLVLAGAETGFAHIEIGGGQSFQIALQQGVNPYRLITSLQQSLEGSNNITQPQILLRGANHFGFHHYSKNIQKNNLDLLVETGGHKDRDRALIIRVFDALNDIENLRYCIEYLVEKNIKHQKEEGPLVHVQAALSYVKASDKGKDALYSMDYYANYAEKLQALAVSAGGSLDSFCIKDMSSQLDAVSAKALVAGLSQFNLPIVFHCHATDESRSLSALYAAAKAGADRVEVAVSPLSGGTSHNDIRNLLGAECLKNLDLDKLKTLESHCEEIFTEGAKGRKDFNIALGSLKQLCQLGIPGGAVPFIVYDLDSQVCKMLGVSLNEAIKLFSTELTRVQKLLGNMPLVTPTADIIAKQVIKNLGNQVRPAQYKLIDPRFCALVLGHYGDVINHVNNQKITIDSSLVDEIIKYCAAIDVDPFAGRVKSGKVYPEPKLIDHHPSEGVSDQLYSDAKEYIEELAMRYPESVKRFGRIEECIMMQVMRPAGNTERLLTRNILAPTETRLRELLLETLSLLPLATVPESREPLDNEQTDIDLLSLLGGYEGIVGHIKYLVLNTEKNGLHSRLEALEDDIVGRYCEVNEEAQANRYYVERRFVALFAAAVFWDLQRICRRTGADSRADINESTANSLGKIISVTLRTRKEAGLGQPSNFLS